MANLNRVFLLGNLTRDPELRYTPGGVAVATFTIAVNRNYTTQNGEKKEETDFIRIRVVGKHAENCAKFLNKGRAVFVEGRLQYRTWETQDGQKKSALEVVGYNVQFLGKPETVPETQEIVNAPEEPPAADIPPSEDDIPF